MKREVLNEYLGKNVIITFFDDQKYEGKLCFCDRFCAEHGYKRPGFYFVGHMCFKCSHVKKLSVKGGVGDE